MEVKGDLTVLGDIVAANLGDAAYKDVGTASTDVTAGNRGIPSGGSDGQVLTKTSGTDYAVAWETPTGGTGGDAPAALKVILSERFV